MWLYGAFARSIVHCTIADNHQTSYVYGAGGIFSQNTNTPPSVGGTVIAGNTSPAAGQADINTANGLASQGYNLIGVGNSGWMPASGDQVGTVSSPLDPMLGPLAANGGPTATMLPLTGSPLIDRSISFGVTRDQRGAGRPYDEPVPFRSHVELRAGRGG